MIDIELNKLNEQFSSLGFNFETTDMPELPVLVTLPVAGGCYFDTPKAAERFMQDYLKLTSTYRRQVQEVN